MLKLLLSLSGITAAVAAQSGLKQIETFWIDSADILSSLDEYRAFYIKPHGCVWTECAIDDTDDGVTGDNRDGDEKWYQYRTQEFCANAAFSLYGVKKTDVDIYGCSRSHWINSFFSYNSADTLLRAAGKQPIVYYNNYANSSNAMCVELEDDDDQNRRKLAGSQDDDKVVSSMGCDEDGNYIIASFNANSCDGNYFLKAIDTFPKYNKQHQSLGCHKIYSGNGNTYAIEYLMSNAWSCDLDLYPNGCPDPYGKKSGWDFALRTVANGGNAQLAYRNMMYKRPIRVLSFFLAFLAFATIIFGYKVKNRDRIKSKGGKVLGYLRCLWEDFLHVLVIAKEAVVGYIREQLEKAHNEKEDESTIGDESTVEVIVTPTATQRKKSRVGVV